MKKIKSLLPFILLSCTSQTSFADEQWYMSATLSAMPGNYSSSDSRSDLFSSNFIMSADYLDSFSFALAYNNLTLNFKDTGSGAFKIKQDSFAGLMQYHMYSDSLGGKISTQLVAHSISNDDTTGLTDDVSVIAPKIAYTNFSKTFYMDFEYARSSYPNNSDLVMQQYTPSVGFAMNNSADWIHFKTYFIESSNKTLTQGEGSLSSLNLKWSHWFSGQSFLRLNNFSASILSGKRIFAVDNDSFSVYNLADVQLGSFSIGLGWKPGTNTDINLIAGSEQYENKTTSDAYTQQYLYASLTQHW